MRDVITQAKRALRVVGLIVLTTLAICSALFFGALLAVCLIKGCISQ